MKTSRADGPPPPAKRLLRGLYRRDAARRIRQLLELWRWRARGRSGTPPPRFKQGLVRDYARRFGCEILVETGTLYGDMLAANRRTFRALYSIELDPRLHARAQARFARDAHIHALFGDSGQTLAQLIPTLDRKTLFWLDAHHMAGGVRGPKLTPIAEELEAILASDSGGDVLLIDDARLFTGGEYPTLEEVEARIRDRHPHWTVRTVDDILRCHGQTIDS